MTNGNSLGLWEVRFILVGMPLPEDKISDGVFSFERLSGKEFENLWLPVLAKVEVEGRQKDIVELGRRRIQDFIGLYVLEVDYAIGIVRDYGASKIAAKYQPSGKGLGASISPVITLHVEREESSESLAAEIKQANNFFRSIDFSSKQNAFIRTALDYLLYSGGSPRKEEKLIDLVISLEALFSGESQELSYSIAHRAASLLGKDREQRGQIFHDIREIYNERSQIVHRG